MRVTTMMKNCISTALVMLGTSAVVFGSEADLVLPDLSSVMFLGLTGRSLLMWGILLCVFGLVFGLVQSNSIKNLPVHRSMSEVSELIYETCKTYLITQGKFLIVLEALIGAIIVVYYGWLRSFEFNKVAIILI